MKTDITVSEGLDVADAMHAAANTPDDNPLASFLFFDFQSETELSGDGTGDPTIFHLTIADPDGSEIATICHRTVDGKHPFDTGGPVVDEKYAIAHHIIRALNLYSQVVPLSEFRKPVTANGDADIAR